MMDKEGILRELQSLDDLAQAVESSQKFGQSMPVGTTKKWAAKIRKSTEAVRKNLGLVLPESATG